MIVSRVFDLQLCAGDGSGTGADSGSADGVQALDVSHTHYCASASGRICLYQFQWNIAG